MHFCARAATGHRWLTVAFAERLHENASLFSFLAIVLSAAPVARPPARPIGPIRISGYPAKVSTGANDPADRVGFTRDGAEYGYCATLAARDPASTTCETTLADGGITTRSSDDATGGYDPAKARALEKWKTSSGLTPIDAMAKPISGTWAFTDVRLAVTPVEGDGAETNALVRVGGSVDGEPAVYPITLRPKRMTFSAWVNDVSISSDGQELGVVAGFFCSEWCDAFAVYRGSTAGLVASIYNDTGFRHHQKGEFARAAQLFLAATFADETSKIAPYNLACAWARLDDPRAESALLLAIQRDPSAKARAAHDADFAKAPWLKGVLTPSR